jgi:hypothetical protein
VALSALTEQRSDQLKQSFGTTGFSTKKAPPASPWVRGNASRGDQSADILAILPYSAGQLKAIDAPAWHFHVRDDHPDTRVRAVWKRAPFHSSAVGSILIHASRLSGKAPVEPGPEALMDQRRVLATTFR